MSTAGAPETRSDQLTELLGDVMSFEGVGSAYAAARDGIDVVLRDRGLRRTTPEKTAESLLLGAHASAVLDGSTATLDEVRAGTGDVLASASVRLSTSLLSQAPTLPRSPLQVFARLHTIVAAGTVTQDALGRPVGPEAAARLQRTARLVSGAPLGVPALVLAAVVHAELATAEPFPSHNGILARALERLVLVSRGVDEKSLTVPEVGHLVHREAYVSNLRGWASGSTSGRQAWLLYAAEAYAAGADASPVRG